MTLLLFLHLLGVAIFLGNIITAAFWKVRADRKNDPVIIHDTVKNVILADYVFTIPGIILIVVSGTLMADQAGYSMSGFNWFTLSLILFAITGLLWLAILIPIQRSLIRQSAKSIKTGVIIDAYKKASLNWAIVGITITFIPIIILYLMISKGF